MTTSGVLPSLFILSGTVVLRGQFVREVLPLEVPQRVLTEDVHIPQEGQETSRLKRHLELLNPQGSVVLPQGTCLLSRKALPCLGTRADFQSAPSLFESDNPQRTSLEFWKGLETALRGSSESQDSRRVVVHV